MRCKNIRELLKSDYLDGAISQTEEQLIKEHLANCPQCLRLEKELQTQHMLFQKAKPQQVPGRVWQNVRDTIVAGYLNQESSVSRGILKRLRESIWAPRPVFALASALTVIIFVVIFAGILIQKRQSFSIENGGESVADYRLNGESEDLLYGLGTNVEEYFL
jgi:predicted anti-sigma-YlaC factor YlaD